MTNEQQPLSVDTLGILRNKNLAFLLAILLFLAACQANVPPAASTNLPVPEAAPHPTPTTEVLKFTEDQELKEVPGKNAYSIPIVTPYEVDLYKIDSEQSTNTFGLVRTITETATGLQLSFIIPPFEQPICTVSVDNQGKIQFSPQPQVFTIRGTDQQMHITCTDFNPEANTVVIDFSGSTIQWRMTQPSRANI